MKTNILLGLGLCLSLFLTSCKEDELVTPAAMNVSMSSNSQTLEEGGEAVEVTIELDRAYDEIQYLYLDYGAREGEWPNFFESSLRQDSIHLQVLDNTAGIRALRIPFVAGETKKVIRLMAKEDDIYRGNRPFELKVFSYKQNYRWIETKAELTFDFKEKTPKPIFGVPAEFATRTVVITSKDDNNNIALILPITVSGRFQFPQTLKIAFSGSAKMGVDYETKEATYTVQPSTVVPVLTTHSAFLAIYNNRDYSTPKTIQITLVEAEEGEIARGQEFDYYRGEKIVLDDTYTVTIKE